MVTPYVPGLLGGESPATPSTAQAPEPLDELTYSRACKTLDRIGLDDALLASAGADQATAESVYAAVLDWSKANAGRVEAAEGAELTARRRLQEAVRQMNVGPRDEGLIARLPQLKRDVAEAQTARNGLYDPLRRTIETMLPREGRTLWATARANAGAPAAYRFAPQLSDQQLTTLGRSAFVKQRRMRTTGDTGIRLEAVQSHDRTVAETLNAAQRQAIATARANRTRLMGQVLSARARVLPPPPMEDLTGPVETD